MEFLPILPELYISDFKRSIHFYIDILGFKIEYQRENPNFAFISYQRSQLMIQELVKGEKEIGKLEYPFGRGINFQIETDNIQKIIDSLEKNSYPIKRGSKDSWYRENNLLHGCREILVMDPDGYLLRFSEYIGEKIDNSDISIEEPFEK
jgi:catechol 2,3-dioxygenase-like lactoylglutathione lyase family enzyme